MKNLDPKLNPHNKNKTTHLTESIYLHFQLINVTIVTVQVVAGHNRKGRGQRDSPNHPGLCLETRCTPLWVWKSSKWEQLNSATVLPTWMMSPSPSFPFPEDLAGSSRVFPWRKDRPRTRIQPAIPAPSVRMTTMELPQFPAPWRALLFRLLTGNENEPVQEVIARGSRTAAPSAETTEVLVMDPRLL